MAIEFKVKGIDHPIAVPDPMKGKQLRSMWIEFKEGKRADALVTVADRWTGTLSDIRSFMNVEGFDPSVQDQKIKEKQKEFDDELAAFFKLSVDKKAELALNFFRVIYWGFTGKRSEDVVIGEKKLEVMALEINKKFYRQNPKAYRPNAMIYRPLIKSNNCNPMVLRLAESTIMADKEMARFGKVASVAEIMK